MQKLEVSRHLCAMERKDEDLSFSSWAGWLDLPCLGFHLDPVCKPKGVRDALLSKQNPHTPSLKWSVAFRRHSIRGKADKEGRGEKRRRKWRKIKAEGKEKCHFLSTHPLQIPSSVFKIKTSNSWGPFLAQISPHPSHHRRRAPAAEVASLEGDGEQF